MMKLKKILKKIHLKDALISLGNYRGDFLGNPIRSKEYVEDECKSLVEQIIKLESQRLKW